MQRIDLDRFKLLMSEVFECFDKKPPSASALVHWADALSEHKFITVERILKDWLRTKQRVPTIADIASACTEIAIGDRENRAAADKAAFAQPIVWKGVTPFGSKCIAEMRAMLATPKRPSKEWAYRIMANPNSTEMQRHFARPVVEQFSERQPGEDDE